MLLFSTSNHLEAQIAPVSPVLHGPDTVRQYVEKEALKRNLPLKRAMKIANCEAGFVPQQSQIPNPTGPNGREDSWGIWQINLPHNPEVTREQAMDIVWSTDWSMDRMESGWWKWTCDSM